MHTCYIFISYTMRISHQTYFQGVQCGFEGQDSQDRVWLPNCFSWLNFQSNLDDPFALASLGILDILMLMCSVSIYVERSTFSNTYRCTHTYDIRTLLKYTYISLSLSLFQWRKTISSFQWFRNQGPLGTFRDLSKSQVMRSTPIWAQRIHATNLPLLATQPCQPSPFQRSTRLDFCCQWVWVSPNY